MSTSVSTSPTKCQELFGATNIGPIASAIRTAIRSITSVEKELEAVYGFGSFFKGKRFNDIDLLAVAVSDNSMPLSTFYKLSSALKSVEVLAKAPVHITLLTSAEYLSRPLRDMNELKPLWRKGP
jgi:predicted nucleotidyltransferase